MVPAVWALLAVLALVLSWVTGAVAFGWAGALMLFIWALGVAAARLGQRGLQVTRELSADRIANGEEVTVELSIEKHHWAPALWLTAAEALPAGLPMRGARGWAGHLPGGAWRRFSYRLAGARRGYYRLGPVLLRTGDLFGLVTRDSEGGGSAHLTVFPRIVAIRHARFPSRRPAGEARARARVLEDPTLIIGIRPYQHGDGLRRVHWRATAHTGQLQSKLFEITAQMDAHLLLNLRRHDYAAAPGDAAETAELAVTAAASIAHHLLDKRQRTALLVLGRDPAAADQDGGLRVGAGRAREQLAAILSVLGRAELGEAAPLAETIRREKDELRWGSLVVVITPRVDEAALSALLGLRASGYEVSVILVGRGARLPAEAQALGAMRISASRVVTEADIRGLGI